MATFLDIGLIDNFSIVFVFLLLFTVIFAFLESIGIFGEGKKGFNAIIALAIAFLISVSNVAVAVISTITPWFVVLFLFIFFAIFSVRMFGVSEGDTIALIKDSRVFPYLIIIFIIILIAGFASTFGQSLLEKGQGIDGEEIDQDISLDDVAQGDGSTKTTSFGTNVINTIVHPKVLGMITILVIGLFTVIFLTRVA